MSRINTFGAVAVASDVEGAGNLDAAALATSLPPAPIAAASASRRASPFVVHDGLIRHGTSRGAGEG